MPHPEYTAWRTDADTVADLDFAQYRHKYIHETQTIKRFLEETRAEHFIIAAPKGFGKTLLLIAKRMQLTEHSKELGRGGEIVDRPPGFFKLISNDRLKDYKSNFQLWVNIWSYSILVAALNWAGRSSLVDRPVTQREETPEEHMDLDPFTRSLLNSKSIYHSPTVVFTALLNKNFSERRAALDNVNTLSILCTTIQSQVAFFIDNVDDFFRPLLEGENAEDDLRNGDESTEKLKEIWVNGQLALVVAAFQLHKTNHHLRVYCTVRKEAFLKLSKKTTEGEQITGHTVEIVYEKNDLKIIFEKNVALMNNEDLFGGGGTWVKKFFGVDTKAMQHRFVTKMEDVFDYVLRHTFYRPRDLMVICGAISAVSVQNRDLQSIRRVVNEQSSMLVEKVSSEMRPFFRLPDLDKLPAFIETNTLSSENISSSTENYVHFMETESGVPRLEWNSDYRQPFCILYNVGMLGWVELNLGADAKDFQRFLKPHEIGAHKNTILPFRERYLMHPALDHWIVSRAGRGYLDRFERENIVGDDLSWSSPQTSSFVVKGDICSYSEVMASEFYHSVSGKLHDYAKLACEDLAYVEVFGGDSIVMIDDGPTKIVGSICELLKRGEQNPGYPFTFRFGGSAGPIEWVKVARCVDKKWKKATVPHGQALRNSARLEPHSPIGKLIVDSIFFETIGSNRDQCLIEAVRSDDVPKLTYDKNNNMFVISKSPTDPVQKTCLYLVSPNLEAGTAETRYGKMDSFI